MNLIQKFSAGACAVILVLGLSGCSGMSYNAATKAGNAPMTGIERNHELQVDHK